MGGGETKRECVCECLMLPRAGTREGQVGHRGRLGHRDALSEAITVGPCHSTSVQTHTMYNDTVNGAIN